MWDIQDLGEGKVCRVGEKVHKQEVKSSRDNYINFFIQNELDPNKTLKLTVKTLSAFRWQPSQPTLSSVAVLSYFPNYWSTGVLHTLEIFVYEEGC